MNDPSTRGESPLDQKPAARPQPRRSPPQISLFTLMLLVTVMTAAAAPLAYLARAQRGSRSSLFVFILICIAAPGLLLIAASTVHGLLRICNRRGGRTQNR